jgi:hypothetical protein
MMSSRCPFPSHSDVRAVWGAGPDGAVLAGRWMDALIAGISHSTASFAASERTPAGLFDRRPALSPTDPERYGWRFWAMHPDGVLVTPHTGTAVDCGTFDAECRACVDPPSPDCVCGIHYIQRARDIISYAEGSLRLQSRIVALQRVLDGEWLPALTYGVAVGAVEVDRCEYQNAAAPSRRAARWHILAVLAPAASPELRASLRERYGCQVLIDASLAACDAVAGRLESSVPPAQMAELASVSERHQ